MLGGPEPANLSIVRASCTHMGGVARWLQASHAGSGVAAQKQN
jgi:hypothetical protein